MKITRFLMLVVLALLALSIVACSGSTAGSARSIADAATLPETIDAATVKSLQNNADVTLLDVREPSEYAAGHIPGVTLIPMGQVADRLAEIPRDKTVIVTCRSGNRSNQVAHFLREQGYTNVHNMQGGIIAWEQAGYPVEK